MRIVVVNRIPVSTIVKKGATVAAVFVGSSVFTVVVTVLVPSWLAAAYFGPISGSGAAVLAMGLVGLAGVAVPICLPLTGLYLFHLLGQMESRARLNTAGRITLAVVGSSVLSVVILILVVVGVSSDRVPSHTVDLLLRYPLACCAFWSIAAVCLFRQLKSRGMSRA